MRHFTVAERRARLGVRHFLAAAATSPAEAARGVLALHATDPASVFLSVRARAANCDVAAVEDALYRERSLIRLLGMRRTMFVVPVDTAPVIQHACADAIAVTQRRRYLSLMGASGAGDAAFLKEVENSTAEALAARGEATASELAADEPRLRTKVRMNEDKAYGGGQNITTWVLLLLAADGRIVRGRPKGGWNSSQWRWSPIETWLPAGMPALATEAARAELARLWLAAFGPGTVADLRWWTGWTAAHTKQALAAVQPVEVDLGNGTTGLVLPDDLDPVPSPDPWIALLPALDPTPMGWNGRGWYLGPHGTVLFDRNGNVGPTVWCDGRIVGGWAQRRSGVVVVRLLEDVGADASAAIDAEAERLGRWFGAVRPVPRFRTPLERELSS